MDPFTTYLGGAARQAAPTCPSSLGRHQGGQVILVIGPVAQRDSMGSLTPSFAVTSKPTHRLSPAIGRVWHGIYRQSATSARTPLPSNSLIHSFPLLRFSIAPSLVVGFGVLHSAAVGSLLLFLVTIPALLHSIHSYFVRSTTCPTLGSRLVPASP